MTPSLAILFVLLTPSSAAGLALMDAGLGRSRNAAHTLLTSLCAMALASVVFFAVGFAWQGYPGSPSHVLTVAGKPWSWIGAGQFFLRGIPFDDGPLSLAVVLGMFGAAIAAIIPVGAAAERWRLGASCASTALLAGFTYPVFAHWAWGGGWLAQLGANYHLGRGFIDSGGSGSIHAVGGLTALAVTWILGPRRGKYASGGMPAAIPAHNAAFVLLGSFLAWFGWLGLNCSGAMLFSGVEASRATLIAVNTTLAAGSALLAAGLITGTRFGKTDASLCANGFVAGLVASSAGCAVMRPAGAVLVGLIAGALAVFSVGWLEIYCKVDDPGGAVSVHAVGGLWGLLAVALVGQVSEPDQWIAQLVGVATLIGFVLPVAYGLNQLLNRLRPQRVAPEAERQGLDLYELGADAYPDFVSHKED